MININELTSKIKQEKLDSIAPNYRKGILSNEDIGKIIVKIALDLNISNEEALTGVMLLMLKGAASSGTPQSLSVELKNGISISKKNISSAYMLVTGNNYIRRLAESLATHIGDFAETFGLSGELSQRINTALKAENGESLTIKEMAWCSSFSQNVPDLADRSSDRLVKLLAEDYKKRFDNKKKSKDNVIIKGKNNKNNKSKK